MGDVKLLIHLPVALKCLLSSLSGITLSVSGMIFPSNNPILIFREENETVPIASKGAMLKSNVRAISERLEANSLASGGDRLIIN